MPSEWDSAQGRVFLRRRVGIGPWESSTVLPWAAGPWKDGIVSVGGASILTSRSFGNPSEAPHHRGHCLYPAYTPQSGQCSPPHPLLGVIGPFVL